MAILAQHTAYNRSFLMVLSSDSRTGATGQTVAVSISKNGGPFALPTGLVTEIGFGWYQLALTPLDTDTLGDLDVHCTSAICDATDFVDEVKTSAQIAAITGPTTAFGATLTRDELITMAYKDIGALEEGEQLAGEKLQDGVKKLNNMALVHEIEQHYVSGQPIRLHASERLPRRFARTGSRHLPGPECRRLARRSCDHGKLQLH
jgi:hypothetical protein